MVKKSLACVLSAVALAVGTFGFAPFALADEMPTNCDGIENCAVVTSEAELKSFFVAGEGSFVTREGKSTLIIGDDFTMGHDYYINGVDLSIYLGDYTVTADDFSFLFYNSSVNIYGGEGVLDNTEGYYAPLYLRSGTVATMHSGTIRGGTVSGGEAAVIVDEDASFELQDGDLYGETWVVTVWKNASFTMNGGTVTTTGPDSIGVSGNGSASGENATLILNGGTITSNDLGVYAPQIGGETVLGENLLINADKCGVEIRAGKLTVDGATINVDAGAEYAFNPNGSGSTASGVAIAVAQHTTKQKILVEVRGGVFTAPVAFAEANPQVNPDEDIEKVSLSIIGGEFNATNGEPVVASEDVDKFIAGGMFNKEPDSDYIVEGYKAYAGKDGAVYNILPVMPEPVGEDDITDEDQDANVEVLGDAASDVLDTLLNNFSDLTDEDSDVTFESNGTVFQVVMSDAKGVLEDGKGIIAELSGEIFSEAELYDEERESLDEIMSEDMVLFGFIDYIVYLNADGYNFGRIIKLPEPIALTYDVSEAPELAEGATRTWSVIRLHWDEATGKYVATVLDTEYDAETGLVSFESDEFSAFVIAYTDDEPEGSDDASGTDASETGAPETGTMTATGASITSAAIVTSVVVGLLVSIVGFAYLIRRR